MSSAVTTTRASPGRVWSGDRTVAKGSAATAETTGTSSPSTSTAYAQRGRFEARDRLPAHRQRLQGRVGPSGRDRGGPGPEDRELRDGDAGPRTRGHDDPHPLELPGIRFLEHYLAVGDGRGPVGQRHPLAGRRVLSLQVAVAGGRVPPWSSRSRAALRTPSWPSRGRQSGCRPDARCWGPSWSSGGWRPHRRGPLRCCRTAR